MKIEDIMISDYGVLREKARKLAKEVKLDLERANKVQKIRQNILDRSGWLKYFTHSDALGRSRSILLRLADKNLPKIDELMTVVHRLNELISDLRKYYNKEIEDKLQSLGIDPSDGMLSVLSIESKFDNDKDIDP